MCPIKRPRYRNNEIVEVLEGNVKCNSSKSYITFFLWSFSQNERYGDFVEIVSVHKIWHKNEE